MTRMPLDIYLEFENWYLYYQGDTINGFQKLSGYDMTEVLLCLDIHKVPFPVMLDISIFKPSDYPSRQRLPGYSLRTTIIL